MNCIKRELVCRFAILLIGLRLLPTSVFEVLGPLTTAASRSSAFVLRVCVLVAVTLVSLPVGNSYAWAKSDSPKPTLHFHVDRLEVEAKEANKRPIEVTVSNVDDPGDSLDFSAEVRDGQRILNTRGGKSSGSNPDQAQMTLRFLDDPLDLTLRDPKNVTEASRQKCNRQDGTYKPIRSGGQFKPSKIVGSTVFVGYNGAKDDLKNIRFRADVTEKPLGNEPERPEDERIKVFTVCPNPPNKDGTYDSPYNSPAPGVASFDVLFKVKAPAEKPWLGIWEYVQTAEIPYSWANLSGQLVAYVEDPATEKIVEETEPATLSLKLFSPTPRYANWLSRIAVVALIFALVMAFILAGGVARYNTAGSAYWRRFASHYAFIIALVVSLYVTWEISNSPNWMLLLLLVVILASLTVLPILGKIEGNTNRQKIENVANNFRRELEFDFKKEWVSTVTTAGAILGTVVSAGVLPEDTFLMPRQQYTALNVVFGLTVLGATTAYNLVHRSGVLLAAGALVLGAAIGELLTVLFLLSEMMYQDIISLWPTRYLQLVLILAAVIMPPIAAWKGIQYICEHNPQADTPPNLPPQDVDALLRYLGTIGITEEDRISLRQALEQDEVSPESGRPGPRVTVWLNRITTKNLESASAEATSKGVDLLAKAQAKSFYLARAVSQYYD